MSFFKFKDSKTVRETVALFAISGLFFGGLGFAVLPGIERDTAAIRKTGFSSQERYRNWGILNHESTRDRIASHIYAEDAWKIEKGSKKVVVAVIDTGVDASHPDLAPNIWRGKNNEYGWDFVSNTPNPKDEHGHGTHVAGIVGAVHNPTKGVAGVAQNVSIMAVKYYSAKNSGDENLKNSVRALHYAIDHGARIINYSGGGPQYSEAEYQAIKKAEEKGVLIVAAAGNERHNTDDQKYYYYPSAYRTSNIISVAANDIHNRLLDSSNWGFERVDLAAPGQSILSTMPTGGYDEMSGTSQATAFVTGVAALLLARDEGLSPIQLKRIIVGSADHTEALRNKLAFGRKLNAYAALLSITQPDQFRNYRMARLSLSPTQRILIPSIQ